MMCLICLKEEDSLSTPIEDNEEIVTCVDCTKNVHHKLAEPLTEQEMARQLLKAEKDEKRLKDVI
tara:strand:+ start:430 stop:624 length:195 start_codon:yes stop_codon:yes gene_type:complete